LQKLQTSHKEILITLTSLDYLVYMKSDSKHQLRKKVALGGVVLGFIVLAIIPFAPAYSSNNSPGIYPIDSKPYGLTYKEWTAKWWQWVLSIPTENNPLPDDTGKNCGQNQNNPNVWFLAGTAGGSAERTCTIPSGKAILLPVLNAECSYAEYPEYKSESELRFCSGTFFLTQPSNMQVTVDGVKLEDLDKYRVQSALFNLDLPKNNIYGVKAGPTQAVSDGYWILLQPLSEGKHEISFGGVAVDFTTTRVESFATQITYHLTVE
jgi:hypothetical protein